MANTPEKLAEQYFQQESGKGDQAFWQKIKSFATLAGREVIEKALTLLYAAQRPETPLWAKTIIYSALAYLVLPTDVIPDFIPFTGYADDLATLATALGAVAMSITPQVKEAAKQQVNDWFGDQPIDRQTSSSDNPIRVISID
jgi:uncharacterized membrane protein YkvA (DUF1232 family)